MFFYAFRVCSLYRAIATQTLDAFSLWFIPNLSGSLSLFPSLSVSLSLFLEAFPFWFSFYANHIYLIICDLVCAWFTPTVDFIMLGILDRKGDGEGKGCLIGTASRISLALNHFNCCRSCFEFRCMSSEPPRHLCPPLSLSLPLSLSAPVSCEVFVGAYVVFFTWDLCVDYHVGIGVCVAGATCGYRELCIWMQVRERERGG